MRYQQQSPKEKREAGKIVALKKPDGLQRNPDSQDKHDQAAIPLQIPEKAAVCR